MKIKALVLLSFLWSLSISAQELLILGVAQDAGKPQLGCEKSCCKGDSSRGLVVSMAILEPETKKYILLEATPDITEQLAMVPAEYDRLPYSVFLTHAHIGHYTGLMYFGREAANTQNINLSCGERMADFLVQNGPWSQLFQLNNLRLSPIKPQENLEQLPKADSGVLIIPFLVPHRDEFSETLGYYISGPNKSLLFIPDIDKWEAWSQDLEKLLPAVDYAFIDGTFFDNQELPGRDMSEIPHPFVVESMNRFDRLPANLKDKIYFIHFNHTNPLWNPNSEESKRVQAAGYHIARRGLNFKL